MTLEIDNQNPKKLIDLARKGDSEAFQALYNQFAVPLFRYIFFRVARKEDAEDILQQVFLKAYRSLGNFKDTGNEPLAYFYTIARTTVIDHQRKKRDSLIDHMAEFAQTVPDQAIHVADLISARSDIAVVKKALQELSEDQQEVLTLKYINDLDTSEIAHILNKTEMAVRQLQSRGIKALKQKLNP